MLTVEIIILASIFAAALLLAARSFFGPFLSKKDKKDCGQCPFADGCGKKRR